MSMMPNISDNAFAVLSFLAAPAILTNASTVLALGTSNRLARASDRARAAAESIVGNRNPSDPLLRMRQADFEFATRRAQLLVVALRRFYLAAGCFAAGTCVALVGAFANYFHVPGIGTAMQIATIIAALLGVGGLVHGSATLLAETRLALRALDRQHAAITEWKATSMPSAAEPPPGL